MTAGALGRGAPASVDRALAGRELAAREASDRELQEQRNPAGDARRRHLAKADLGTRNLRGGEDRDRLAGAAKGAAKPAGLAEVADLACARSFYRVSSRRPPPLVVGGFPGTCRPVRLSSTGWIRALGWRERIGTAYRSRGGRPHWPTQRRDTLPLPSHPVSSPPNSPSYP